MAEKVLFEYRARSGEPGYEIHFGHGNPFMRACCHGENDADVARDKVSKSARRPPDRSRRPVRDTLDFLEGIFHDLYGGEEANESRAAEP